MNAMPFFALWDAAVAHACFQELNYKRKVFNERGVAAQWFGAFRWEPSESS